MRKTTAFLFLLVLLAASVAVAQTYPKVTYYGGYATALEHRNSGTFIISDDRHPHGHLRLPRGTTRAADTFGDGADAHTDTNVIRDRTLLAVAGVELADNAAPRRRPFAHVLAGIARQKGDDTQTSTGPFDFTLHDSVTSFAMKIGVGLDLPVTSHLDIRAIEVDYTPIFAGGRHTPGNADFDQSVAGKTAHNILFGFGLVLH